MVFESILNPSNAERHPGRMFFFGLLYFSVGIIISLKIFWGQASMVMVFLTTLACLPLVYNTIKEEESKDDSVAQESLLLKEHARAVRMFIFLFFGFVVACIIWYVALPSDATANLFGVQIGTINDINSGVTANATGQIGSFFTVLFNNLWVLAYVMLFAFVFGAGAIFILTWNASVIGAAIGSFIRKELSAAANAVGLDAVGNYFSTFSVGLAMYAIHGIPEILGYFVAGLAASIISIAAMKHGHDMEHFKKVLLDSTDLLLISVLLILMAAFLEVFVTPLFF
ncbi:MAG: stage II sporulation protein M [DPANN group archaeon]|nr:stage II sporulation protein M [DPANN group archaeon]